MEHFVLMSIFTPENTVGKKNDPDKDLVQTRIAELENEMLVLSLSLSNYRRDSTDISFSNSAIRV